MYLGLTGTRMNAADAIYCGFADLVIPFESRDEVLLALATRRRRRLPMTGLRTPHLAPR